MTDRSDLLRLLPTGSKGAEVGVYHGTFSAVIVDIVRPTLLYLIDCWQHQTGSYQNDVRNDDQAAMDEAYKMVCNMFSAQIENGSVKILRKYSTQAIVDIQPESLDWVYIDANHTFEAVFTDLVLYSTTIKPGGVILGHDYVERPEKNFGVVAAVNTFCSLTKWKIEHITNEEWPSYLLRKKT